jgi:SHS family lactate transporter-like MFS transporter
MTKDLHMSPAAVGWPPVFTNAATFIASFLWGGLSDKIGRRWAMIIPAILGFCITPVYLLTTDYMTIVVAFTLQGACAGAIYGQNPSYLSERFPTEVRATAAAFCYHQGAIFAGLVAPVLTYIAVNMDFGFARPMLVLTSGALISFVISLLLGPETKGKVLIADLEIVPAE